MASLSGTVTVDPSDTPNLATLGGTDWWTIASAANETKSSGGAVITIPTTSGGGTLTKYTGDPRVFTFSGGTPTGSGTASEGVFNNVGGVDPTGIGLQCTVPADTNVRRVRIYVGGFRDNSSPALAAQLVAHLSDSSSADYTDSSVTFPTANAANQAVYTLTYQAGSASQTLHITWLPTQGGPSSNVSIAAIALELVSAGFTLSVANGSYAMTGEPQALLGGNILAAGFGAYSLIGKAQTLSFGASVVLLANAGIYNYAGAGSSSDFASNAGTGAYALTGVAVTLSGTFDNIMPAAAGVYNYTGQAVTLTAITSSTLVANFGSYVMNGIGQVLSTNAGGGGTGVGTGPVGVNGVGSQFIHPGRIT